MGFDAFTTMSGALAVVDPAGTIIANDGDLETLKTRVRSLHRRYLELSDDN